MKKTGARSEMQIIGSLSMQMRAQAKAVSVALACAVMLWFILRDI